MKHTPVLLNESLQYLGVKPNGVYLDSTFGGGGHTKAICDASAHTATILAIDADDDAIERANDPSFLETLSCAFEIEHANYGDLELILKERKLELDGALFDLGVSSFQLDDSQRGFSFLKDEPLNMKMGKGSAVDGARNELTAYDVVNSFSETGLADVIYGYGEEKFARRIARKIVERREEQSIETTFDLVECIKQAVPVWYRFGKTHMATRTFQAIRIATNNELENVRRGIEAAFVALKPKGRLCVISFHSLEDRIVKQFFNSLIAMDRAKPITKKPVVPHEDEIINNSRARSAKLRAIEAL